MVSLLSFFTGKKKSRRLPPSPTNPTNGALTSSPSTGQTPPRHRQPRFLSLRHRKSSKDRPVAPTPRRASTEAARKSSPKAKSPGSELPRLALGWESTDDGTVGRSSLGLEGVGRPPRLAENERKLLDRYGYGYDGVMQGWKWFGKALRDTGLDTLGIMSSEAKQDKENQYLLLALFTLVISPERTDRFPSLTTYYQSISSPSSASWSDRLTAIIKDMIYPADFAQVLLFLLHRLNSPPPQSSDHTPVGLDVGLYKSFVASEKDEGYPMDAYEKLFSPRIDTKQMSYLEEIFEVWAALAAHSDNNGMTGGKLSRLLGWWVWGSSISATAEWTDLYMDWQEAGRRVEHLFYAWIRSQSIKQNLPTRLLQLVEGYPFGTSEMEGFLPSAPSASFKHQVLHISLTSASPLPPRDSLSPQALKELAIGSRESHSSSLPLWHLVQSQLALSDASGVVKEASEVGPDAQIVSTPPVSSSDTQPTTEPMYRPFSTIEPEDSQPSHVRRRSQSYSGAQSLLLGPPLQVEASPAASTSTTNRLVKQSSTSMLRPSSDQPESWENFMETGFADSSESKLELSPQVPTNSPRPLIRGVSFGSENKAATTDAKSLHSVLDRSSNFSVASEEVIDIDDLFTTFVQDNLADPLVTTTWPAFALIQLADPIKSDDKEIAWVLIDVQHRPSPPEVITPVVQRAASPTESTTAKTLNMFRRSSSFGIGNTSRLSLFGRSRSGPRTSASTTNLPMLSEDTSGLKTNDTPPLSAAPTEYTITEMGEMVKVPASTASIEPSTDILSDSSLPNDWEYRAEGRAHLIFKYIGPSPIYRHRVLRVRKPNVPADDADQVGAHWRDTLLPRLVAAEFLLTAQPVNLKLDWTEKLFEAADAKRPEARRKETGSLVDALSGKVWAALMDDTTTIPADGADKILTIEIKPKWGFLPRAETIVPPEAVPIKSETSRYVLHRHFRNESIDDTYDPLDLFSGEESRVKKALDGLWGMWESSGGVKNNWRVYVDGQPISPSEASSIPLSATDGSLSDKTSAFFLPALTSSPVLVRLSELQSSFDPIDISSLAQRYRQNYPDREIFDLSLIDEPTNQELDALVDKYLSSSSKGNPVDWSLREYMLGYAISAIFKDCSIFITVPLKISGDSWEVAPGGKTKIIDLDLKPVKSLRKWYDLDEAIWRNWYETYPSRRAEGTATLISSLKISQSGSSTTGLFTTAISVPTSADSGQALPTRSASNGTAESQDDIDTGVSQLTGSTATPSRKVGDGEEVALAEALAMTPSKPTFDHEHIKSNGFSPSKSNPADMISPGLDLDDDEEGGKAGLPPIREESPGAGRKKRSLAPSPSPTPFIPAELPIVRPTAETPTDGSDEDAEAHIGSGARAAETGGVAVVAGTPAVRSSEQDGPGPQLPTAPSSAAPISESQQIPSHEEDSSASGPAEKLAHDQSAPSDMHAGSGTSTPFEAFSTPMSELPESAVLQQSVRQSLPETPAIEELTDQEAAPSIDLPVAQKTPRGNVNVDLAGPQHSYEAPESHRQREDGASNGEDFGNETFGAVDADDFVESSVSVNASSNAPAHAKILTGASTQHPVSGITPPSQSAPAVIDPYASEDLPTATTVRSSEIGEGDTSDVSMPAPRPLESLLTPHIAPVYQPETAEAIIPSTELSFSQAEGEKMPPVDSSTTTPLLPNPPAAPALDEPLASSVPSIELPNLVSNTYPGDGITEGTFLADTGRLPVIQHDAAVDEFVPHSLAPVLERGESALQVKETTVVEESPRTTQSLGDDIVSNGSVPNPADRPDGMSSVQGQIDIDHDTSGLTQIGGTESSVNNTTMEGSVPVEQGRGETKQSHNVE